MSHQDDMSNYYHLVSDSDSIYESDTPADDETLSSSETNLDDDTSSESDTVSVAGTIETLPLYEPEAPTLPPHSIPICPHHHLSHSTLTNLLSTPRPAGYHLLPACQHIRCPSRAPLLTINAAPHPQPHVLTIPYTIAYTALTSPCAFTTLSRSFNRTRITNILASIPLYICPHLSLDSPVVARLFSLDTMLHVKGRCCAPRDQPPPFRCGDCADLGFHTLLQWQSVERAPSERVGCPHVEVQMVVTVGLGRAVVGEEDLEWAVHACTRGLTKVTQEGWRHWQARVESEIFWLPRLEGRKCMMKGDVERERGASRRGGLRGCDVWRKQRAVREGKDGRR